MPHKPMNPQFTCIACGKSSQYPMRLVKKHGVPNECSSCRKKTELANRAQRTLKQSGKNRPLDYYQH